GPGDLLRRREESGGRRVRPLDVRSSPDRRGELAASDLDDPARTADLLLLRRQRCRLVDLAARLVAQRSRRRIEGEGVALLRILDGFAALHDVQPEIERVAAEDRRRTTGLSALRGGRVLDSGARDQSRRLDRLHPSIVALALATALEPQPPALADEALSEARVPLALDQREAGALVDVTGGDKDIVRPEDHLAVA